MPKYIQGYQPLNSDKVFQTYDEALALEIEIAKIAQEHDHYRKRKNLEPAFKEYYVLKNTTYNND